MARIGCPMENTSREGMMEKLTPFGSHGVLQRKRGAWVGSAVGLQRKARRARGCLSKKEAEHAGDWSLTCLLVSSVQSRLGPGSPELISGQDWVTEKLLKSNQIPLVRFPFQAAAFCPFCPSRSWNLNCYLTLDLVPGFMSQ